MELLYSFAISVYVLFIKLASPFNKKAAKWINGRKNIFEELKNTFKNPVSNLYWFHASSLGEFEQARPVMELLKKENKDAKIILTFFSPSGYEIRKNYSGADYIFYLPADTKQNAEKFLEIVKPRVAVFVKYDFWFNYINSLSRKQIPLVYFSVLIRNTHFLNKWYSKWFIKSLKNVSYFFVQDEPSYKWFLNKGINKVELSGDTRFDRVIEILNSRKEIEELIEFAQHKRLFIAGSTWKADDLVISETTKLLQDQSLKLVIAPHEINEARIEETEKIYAHLNPVRFSKKNYNNSRCLIIDNIGMLSSLYYYANITYVGGGFNKTVHNTQEPAVYGKPVIFGPNFQKFNEIIQIVECEGGFTIENAEGLKNVIEKLISDPEFYLKSSLAAASVIKNGAGSSKRIVEYITQL